MSPPPASSPAVSWLTEVAHMLSRRSSWTCSSQQLWSRLQCQPSASYHIIYNFFSEQLRSFNFSWKILKGLYASPMGKSLSTCRSLTPHRLTAEDSREFSKSLPTDDSNWFVHAHILQDLGIVHRKKTQSFHMQMWGNQRKNVLDKYTNFKWWAHWVQCKHILALPWT